MTSYEFLINKRDAPRMAALRWHYVILDEGHRVKNADCALARALRGYRVRHKLLLSGTPVQNALNELWALLNFLLPDMFGSAEEFDAWFGSRLAAGGVDVDGGCGGASEVLRQEQVLIVTNRLHQVLRPFLLRRTKAILAAALPPKIERAVACPASAYQAAMLALLRAKGAAVAHGGGGGGVQGVNNVIMEMRKVRGPRALQFSRPGVCSERGVTRALAWLQVCNDPVTSRLHVPGADEALADHCTPASVQLGGKMAALTTILRRLVPAGAPPSPPALRARAHLCKPLESVLTRASGGRVCSQGVKVNPSGAGHKLLLFSTMTTQLDSAEEVLEWLGVRFERLDGNTRACDRAAALAAFSSSPDVRTPRCLPWPTVHFITSSSRVLIAESMRAAGGTDGAERGRGSTGGGDAAQPARRRRGPQFAGRRHCRLPRHRLEPPDRPAGAPHSAASLRLSMKATVLASVHRPSSKCHCSAPPLR